MYKDGERMMAWIANIDEIKPIPDADKIEAYRVGGWWVVGQKNSFEVGQPAIYCSIDSWIPNGIAPFLTKGKEPREYNGVKGEKLKTITLKKQISQGLLLPTSILPEGIFSIGDDVTEILNIQKWERPMDTHLAGICKGNFPSWGRRSDQERCQNLSRNWEALTTHNVYEVTEKLDGSSMTVYYHTEHGFGVCSRNLDLKRDETNSFWKKAIEMDFETKLQNILNEFDVQGVAIQGELYGYGIQKNIYGIKGHKFAGFNVWVVPESGNGYYVDPATHAYVFNNYGIESVPVIERYFSLEGMTISDVLAMAEGKSKLADVEREGLVFKMEYDGNISWKAISNKFLIQNEIENDPYHCF